MMKRRLIPLMIVLILFSLGGCTLKEPKRVIPPSKNEPVSKNLTFRRVDLGSAPPKVAENFRRNRTTETSSLIADGGKFWALITRGQKPTGGYSVNITRVIFENDKQGSFKLKVFYVYGDPGPGQFVTQALTYPAELVKIEGIKEQPDKIEFIKTE